MVKSDASPGFLKVPEIIARIGSPFERIKKDLPEGYFDSGYEIEVIKGVDEGTRFVLDRKELNLGNSSTVGQLKEGYILFNDPTISKIHAQLKWEEALEKFVIYHRSATSPTLVNGRAVMKSLLSPGHIVGLGDLEFKVISIKDKIQLESSQVWNEFKSGDMRGEKSIMTGFKLVVVDGPDKGRTFDLDKNLMIIGRQKGPGDMRDTSGILLTDSTLPFELALLIWNESEEKYTIFESHESPVHIKVFRVVETDEGTRFVGSEYENMLNDKDAIMAGNTVMVIHSITEVETPEAAVDIEKELELEMEALENEEIKMDGQTAVSSFKIDYAFEILDGKDQGNKISLLSNEIKEGRKILFGKSGEHRQNDIEFDDEHISNEQGYFLYSEGNLYLINQTAGVEVFVNNFEVGPNEKICLNNGDRIKIGGTFLGFTDNRVISALRRYSIDIVSVKDPEDTKHIPITKTMIFIGRGSSCDMRILDPEVSRLHCVLSFKEGRFHLEHKSKVNPTFVNGISLKIGQDRIIFPGDTIYLSRNTILKINRDS